MFLLKLIELIIVTRRWLFARYSMYTMNIVFVAATSGVVYCCIN